ncbi:carbohydrate sulfotransferase 15-like isoform X2 [Ostrea edulis]|nr:carbohydrate sulfotransferase 15-like isoform X2 [Ostrea edulis]XP_048762963.2 carbohydrate sulfotransferase 15-like isoform X2 [Ostrea edulis]
MSSTKYVQFCACLTSSLLIISMEFYMKDQTKTYQTTPMPLPLVIPSPVKEPNKTLCPKGRPKPIIDDVLCMSHFDFSTLHKNPCWKSVNGKFKCLPYFQVIGMDKCGTTDLFARISRHPDVVGNKKDKETMWWSWERYGFWLWSRNAKKTYLSDYINYFKNTAEILNNATQEGGQTQLITGDGTPMDMWDFRGWKMIPQNKGLKEPRYLTPHLIKHINPVVKLIVILRNPVDRLYSDYYFIDNGERFKNSTTFHNAVIRAINVLQICLKHSSLRSCLFDYKVNENLLRRKTRIHLGFYATYLQEWLSVFPRDQILILRTEDYAANVTSVMRKVFKFLALRDLTDDELEKFNVTISQRVYVTKDKLGKKTMMPETRRILESLYSSDTEDLYQLLKDESFLWESNSGVTETVKENYTQLSHFNTMPPRGVNLDELQVVHVTNNLQRLRSGLS